VVNIPSPPITAQKCFPTFSASIFELFLKFSAGQITIYFLPKSKTGTVYGQIGGFSALSVQYSELVSTLRKSTFRSRNSNFLIFRRQVIIYLNFNIHSEIGITQREYDTYQKLVPFVAISTKCFAWARDHESLAKDPYTNLAF
jgi:hypothetical protein